MLKLKIIEVLNLADEILTAGKIENPKLNAELILSHVLKLKRTELYLNPEIEISATQQLSIETMLSRRLKNEPLQYVFGETEFYGFRFLVNPSVLIPRPETESLVEIIFQNEKTAISILDIGTGSGCIAISLKKLLPNCHLTAIDISEKAIEVAMQNSVINEVDVDFLKSDLFENIIGIFEIIVSNPPYIPDYEYQKLPVEIKNFEPQKALRVEDDGTDFYKKILQQAKEHLTENGKIYFEIGFDQTKRVKQLALENGFSEVEVFQDLNGFDRIVRIC